jgi:hypothetical protein
VLADNDNVNAAILSLSIGRAVAGDGMILSVSCGRQALWGKTVSQDEKPDEFRGTGGGKLPVGSHL